MAIGLQARAVLSAANHAELLAELERARLWMRYAMEELTAEQITRVTERAEYDDASHAQQVRGFLLVHWITRRACGVDPAGGTPHLALAGRQPRSRKATGLIGGPDER
jgi:hypothetical protein